MKFYFIYKRLAHPGLDGYTDPYTLEDRLAHIAEFRNTRETAIPWICDNMKNELKDALGGAPNSEFVLDPQGRIVRMRRWSDPVALRRDLTVLVGAPEGGHRLVASKRTPRSGPPDRHASPTGVVPSVEVPPGSHRIKIVPQRLTQPSAQFYAKLEAFAQQSLLETGDGALYFRFRLDPVYHVHWNNLAPPIEYALRILREEAPSSESPWHNRIAPIEGKGPKLKEPADADPREFIVDLCGFDTDLALELTVKYFACSDAEGWCRPVTQSYLIHLQAAPDHRRRMDNRTMTGLFGRR